VSGAELQPGRALRQIICSGCGGYAHPGKGCPPEAFEEEDTVKIEPGDPLYPALGGEDAR
jgi:hypothetical protein